MKSVHDLDDAQVSDIVQMALSDHVAFADIEHQYGLKEKEVVALSAIPCAQGLIVLGVNGLPHLAVGVNIINNPLCRDQFLDNQIEPIKRPFKPTEQMAWVSF